MKRQEDPFESFRKSREKGDKPPADESAPDPKEAKNARRKKALERISDYFEKPDLDKKDPSS